MTHTVIVTGAGGVGKTTLSAALGITAARAGLTTLVLTVDPARRLADALGLQELGNDPHPVAGVPGMSAAMLDATASWDAIAQHYAPPEAAARLSTNGFFRAIADRFPAAQAFAAGEEMARHVESRRWDLIVVDTPPAAGGIDFFAAPTRMAELIGGRVLRWITGAGIPGRRRLYRVTARPVLKAADILLGGPLLELLAEFLLDLRTMYDGLTARSRTINDMFSIASIAVVTTADAAPLREAHQFFTDASVPAPEAVIFNRVLPDEWLAPSPPLAAELPPNVRVAAEENLRNWSAEAVRQSDARVAFASRHRVPMTTIPLLARPPTDVDALVGVVASATGRPLIDLIVH